MREYTWTENQTDDIWRHDRFGSIEACIKDAVKNGKKQGDTIVIGICEDYIPQLSASDLLDLVQENACEECAEAAEDWLEFERSKYKGEEELQKEIDKVFNEWLKKTNQEPAFHRIHPLANLAIIEEI